MDLLSIFFISIVSLIVLFLLTKLMGNKQISQMNMFDYIIGITIGSIAAELATELEEPLRPALAMIVYGIVAVLISLCASKSNRWRRFFAGKPLILMKNGVLSREMMKKAKLDINEFLAMARIAGYFDISQIKTAVFEQNGNVSFLPRGSYRPATPGDMKLPVEDEELPVNLIVDGNVMEGELRLTGKDIKWLHEQLKKQGYSSPGEVFLAAVDNKDKLNIFPMKKEGKGQKKSWGI